jgi:uncharacterized protein (TIGR02453 family)
MLNEESFRFMADLYRNNNKPWFDDNRKRYEEHVRNPMKALAEDLEDPVSLLLPEFSGKAKISRINNDIRFSPNKPLYKEHVWISFGSGTGPCSDIFAAIDRHGWTCGTGICDPKREGMENWRQNLLQYADLWRRYAHALGIGKEVKIFAENPYKKPLYPDIPDDLLAYIQPRGIWIVDVSRTKFERSEVEEFFRGFCKFAPVYLFMTIPTPDLPGRLKELGSTIIAPDQEIDTLWKAFK